MKLDKQDLIARDLVSQKTNAVYDNKFNKVLKDIPWVKWYTEESDPLHCRLAYIDMYKQYLSNMKLNTIHGLDRFKQHHLINGTTQTFDECYHRHATRRLRLYKGEYAYHKRIITNFVFIEDAPIELGDYVIVSIPHCTTGDVPDGFYELLDDCYDKSVPVIVDCAYIGTSYGVEFSVNHPAIESVSFSLTKGTGTGRIRSGVRYSNINDDYPISQQNKYDHIVGGAARVGMWVMQNLESPDFIPALYREHQLTACADAGLTPTPCMHVALADSSWNDFSIDGKYYRVGIRALVKARKQGQI